MGDGKVADWVIGQLKKQSAKDEAPFFLACGFYRPHLPWYVPRDYFEKFPLEKIELPRVLRNDFDDIPAAGRKMAKPNADLRKVIEHGEWKKAVRGYFASIAFTDKMLGRVLDALAASPLGV